MTLLMLSGPTGLSWYTSERNPTLNIDSGSSTEGLAVASFFDFGGVGPFGGLGVFGAFSFLALEGLLLSAGALVFDLISSDFIWASARTLPAFESPLRSGEITLFSMVDTDGPESSVV